MTEYGVKAREEECYLEAKERAVCVTSFGTASRVCSNLDVRGMSFVNNHPAT